MPEPRTTTGDVVAAVLEACGVGAAFGVISIHNMAILDAIGRRARTRFVPSRGEAGALNMADGYARVRDALGVAITSTGTGCGNAAGGLVRPGRRRHRPRAAHGDRGGSRRAAPDFGALARACALDYVRVRAPGEFAARIAEALSRRGPRLVEIDMTAIGPMEVPFAGPAGGHRP